MKRCKLCVIPEGFPHVAFDGAGVCGLCRSYRKGPAAGLKRRYRNEFERLLKRRAGTGQYDILACYSGGKDSTYALSIFKERYALKTLAFTFDNGFIPRRTYDNIRTVVERLSVDHILFKPRFDLLKRIFKMAAGARMLYPRKTIERSSAICASCIGLVKYTALKLAIEKEIPFIGYGWSPGQAPVTSSILKIEPAMMRKMEGVLKAALVKAAGREAGGYLLGDAHYAKGGAFPYLVHPLAFLGYDEKKMMKKVRSLGWERPDGLDDNSTNCLLNSFANEAHETMCGFHPYTFETAALVREGYLSRAEGLRRIRRAGSKTTIDAVKRRLGIKR